MDKRIFPSPELFDKTIKIIALLESAPDGFIFKLSNTGRKFNRFNYMKAFSKWNSKIFDGLELYALSEDISIVSGEIEVIEIKADKAFIVPNQAKSYKRVIAEGYPLHFFHLKFVSFEENQFEIEEKLMKKMSELKFISRKLRREGSIQ